MFHDVSIHIITQSNNMLNEGVNCGLIKCEAKIPLFVDTTLTSCKIVRNVAAVLGYKHH